MFSSAKAFTFFIFSFLYWNWRSQLLLWLSHLESMRRPMYAISGSLRFMVDWMMNTWLSCCKGNWFHSALWILINYCRDPFDFQWDWLNIVEVCKNNQILLIQDLISLLFYIFIHKYTVALYTLTYICIFSMLFYIHILRCWQGEFV